MSNEQSLITPAIESGPDSRSGASSEFMAEFMADLDRLVRAVRAAERYAEHDPDIEWTRDDGTHYESALDGIMQALDHARSLIPDRPKFADDSPLARAVDCARDLRDYALANETDGLPFTMPVIYVGRDEIAAEVSVTTAWGFASDEIREFDRIAMRHRGRFSIFGVASYSDEKRLKAEFRFVGVPAEVSP